MNEIKRLEEMIADFVEKGRLTFDENKKAAIKIKVDFLNEEYKVLTGHYYNEEAQK